MLRHFVTPLHPFGRLLKHFSLSGGEVGDWGQVLVADHH